jgi:hypothetical protein
MGSQYSRNKHFHFCPLKRGCSNVAVAYRTIVAKSCKSNNNNINRIIVYIMPGLVAYRPSFSHGQYSTLENVLNRQSYFEIVSSNDGEDGGDTFLRPRLADSASPLYLGNKTCV